jgi:LuxR family transcriptional regulator/LuxR family quorum-sensing system transcriptional regulator CciR
MAGDLAVSNPIAFAWDALVEAELLADRKIDGLFPAAFKRLVFSPAIAADGNIGLFTFILRPSHPALSPEALAEIEFVCQYIYRRAIALTRREFDVRLSPREVEIASRMASGKSNRVIAAELGVSSNTVDTMVRRIFTKLNVDNRVEAALECVTHQLIQL